MSEAATISRLDRREARVLRVAFFCAAAAVVLALVLLIRTTDYMFVFFMFLGPPLLAVATLGLGWVVLQELRAKKVF